MVDAIVPIHELLSISETMSAGETARLGVFQEIVQSAMRLRRIARSIRYLEKASNRDEIPIDMSTFGRALVGISHRPFIFIDDDDDHHHHHRNHVSPADENGYTWLGPRTVLRLTTHLDDEKNLQATVMDLVMAAVQRPIVGGIAFGIGLSLTHCVIVRINVDDRTFKHTPVLQFLPSLHAQSPSTPGISALVRLGYVSDPLVSLGILPGKLPLGHLLNNMPLELWSHIAQNLFSVDDLITLGSVSPRAWEAANNLLRYPYIGNLHVAALSLSSPMNSEKPPEFETVVYDEVIGPSLALANDCEEVELYSEGMICFHCKWDGFQCRRCMDGCRCPEGSPWAMPYVSRAMAASMCAC